MTPFSTDELIDYFAGFLDATAMAGANQGEMADGSLLPLWTPVPELYASTVEFGLDPGLLGGNLYLDQSYDSSSRASEDTFVSEDVLLQPSFAVTDTMSVGKTFERSRIDQSSKINI
jgi:hypothetical protein